MAMKFSVKYSLWLFFSTNQNLWLLLCKNKVYGFCFRELTTRS